MMEKIIKPLRERFGLARSAYYGVELGAASQSAWRFIVNVIDKYKLKREDGYHIETRCVGIVDSNINDTACYFSDNEILQLLDKHGEVVAMAYVSRNDMNCAEVVMVELLNSKKNND